MKIVLGIIFGVAVISGIVALLVSKKSDPKERATEAAMMAGAGGLTALGCLLQLILPALMLLFSLWLLGKILGH